MGNKLIVYKFLFYFWREKTRLFNSRVVHDDVVEIVDAYTDYFYDAFPRCEKLSQIERLVNDMKNKIENDEADRKAGRPTDDEIADAYSWGF